ncbi:3'-5' exonuclease [Spirochaeta cellobiosiphila]|uniref:3'-5' exonuclease n=1 Tax=Spirochaeta cellobiosiphila TaxID=504483 RepID=UPI0003F8BFA5|nr:3'-5' exonuclease [Spirochaeta cellobiosiphila]
MFKLNNPLLVLDLEATAGKDDKGYQTNNYIIDIGSVLLDTDLKVIGEYDHLVKPGESISDFIHKLTGISNELVQEEPYFDEISKDWHRWIESFDINLKKLRLAAWGNYFDIPLLRRNYQQYDLKYPFSGTALDIKSIAFLWLSLSGRRTDRYDVQSMAQMLNIQVDGTFHRAITDARAETALLQRFWSDLEGFYLPQGDGPFTHYNITRND